MARTNKRGELGGKSFGGSHADFGSGVGKQSADRLAGHHGTEHVADGERFRAFLLGLALRGQGIGGLAGLGDEHGQHVGGQHRVAIAELAAVIDFNGQARQFLDHELAGQGGVPACPAGHDLDLPKLAELPGGDVHFVQEDAAGFLAHAPQHGIADGAGLLVDLLEHEMLVAALFGQDGVPEDMRDLAFHGAPFEIAQPHTLGGEHGQVAVAEEEHVAGVAEDGGHVGGNEVFAVTQPDDDRGAGARGHDLVRIGAGDDGQGEDSAELADGLRAPPPRGCPGNASRPSGR